RKVFSSHIFHVIEEILRLWMLIRPSFDVGFERIVKSLWSQNILSEYDQAHCRLAVSDEAQISQISNVRIGVDSFAVGVRQEVGHPSGLIEGAWIFAVVEFECGVVVDESVEALVHPCVASFVAA